MKYIRSLILLFAFCVFAIGSFFLNIIVFPTAKLIMNDEKYMFFSSNIVHKSWRFLINFISILGLIKLNIENIKEISYIKNKVIVATHPSFIDIVILIGLIPYSTCFAKQELAKNPLMGNILKSFFITNDVDIEELKTESKKMLDLGFNVIIFPSGIRHHKNEYPKIRKGASLVALNASKDIIPIKLFADGDFLFINKPFYDGDEKTVNFEVEVCEKINLSDFITESEIITKKNITKQITNELYS